MSATALEETGSNGSFPRQIMLFRRRELNKLGKDGLARLGRGSYWHLTQAVRAGRQRRGSQAGTHGMRAARQEGRADEKASSGWQRAVVDAATCYAVSACRFRDAWELPRWVARA